MIKVLRKIMSIILMFSMTISLIITSYAEETSSGQSINDYEKEALDKINEIIESSELESDEMSEEESSNILESVLDDVINNKIEESESVTEEISTYEVVDLTDIATQSEIAELQVDNTLFLKDGLLGAGNHPSTASPSVVIHSTYDRYEIYTGENAGTVRISDDNGVYYNDDTNVKVIRDMMDTHNNSPILLNLANNVQFFGFDNSNDNYILLPDGFVEDIVARYSGNGYLNPQGISKLDHIKVNVEFNNSKLGKYNLFEYGVLYYLSCYEGVLGEYYYYDPNTTDVDRAASFYINNKIMARTYNIVSEYYYKSISGEQLSFKPTWVVNNDSLVGINKESYAKQWVNFPYFLIKTGEKYWNLRDSIEQSTYLNEYSEGYYEQYLTEKPYGNVAERLLILDDIYKTEENLINDNTRTQTVHPYVKSDDIKISGNFRADTMNDSNKFRAGAMLPYNTYAVIDLNIKERRAKTVQVYLNGEKLITNSNRGLYVLNNGKCQIRIDGSKLLDEENSRNVISFIVIDEAGDYVIDAKGRIVNSYISLIRSTSINKNSYSVKFITNGGTELPIINVEEGNVLSLPANPTKNNFVFQGWYNDPNFQEKFDTNEYIVGNKTLYALWGEKTNINTNTGNRGKSGSNNGGGGGGGSSGGSSGGGTSVSAVNGVSPNNLNASQVANGHNTPGSINAISVRGSWIYSENKWKFIDTMGVIYKDRWAYIDTSSHLYNEISDWYRFDENGDIVTGFYFENGKMYFLNDGVLNRGDEGKMLTGWHWLPSFDGGYCCYYFEEEGTNRGMLVSNGIVRDGYIVDAYGRWCENGQVKRRNYR